MSAATDVMAPELADVLAYLEQRRDNCAAVAGKAGFEAAEAARVMQRQCEVIIGDLRAGLHEGSAGVRARLVDGEARTDG